MRISWADMRQGDLFQAAKDGHTDGVKALLVAGGADVLCKDPDGYIRGIASWDWRVFPDYAEGADVKGLGLCNSRYVHVLVQEHCAAPCVDSWAHGDGDHAGGGRRGRALQEQERVRPRALAVLLASVSLV